MGCPVAERNPTYAEPDGAANAPLLVMAESLGRDEANARPNRPLIGPSGQFLWRQAKRAGFQRTDCRVHNVCACRIARSLSDQDEPPPVEAINHCAVHREPVLREPHRAILTLGAAATREVCRFFGIAYSGSLDEWRGYVVGDGTHPWIIPTYHPAYLIPGKGPGNLKYTGVFIHDLKRAWSATQGFTRSAVDLVIDPDIDWFRNWAQAATAETWLAVDIETPTKDSDRILRVNFAYAREQGITVPFEGPYIPVIRHLLALCRCWLWNKHFDCPRLRKAGCPVRWAYDAKDAWHVIQSDMGADDKDERDRSSKTTVAGNSLGFVAPFYSDLPPWKHLSDTDQGYYAAMDGVQTLRVAYGLAEDLRRLGQWDVFERHCAQLDREVLEPATLAGLPIDVAELDSYDAIVTARQAEVGRELEAIFPPECLPLSKPYLKRPPAEVSEDALQRAQEALQRARQEAVGEGGWGGMAKRPTPILAAGDGSPGSVVYWPQSELVQVCRGCGETEVTKAHACSPGVRGKVELDEVVVLRWARKLPFNPESADQIRSYLELKGIQTGQAKGAKTSRQTTNAMALEKLAPKDPFFARVLERRELTKTKSTYIDGVRSRLGEDGCIHPVTLHRPSTLRTSSVDPNIQNVVHGDEEEREKGKPWDPSGFRRCIVAGDDCELIEIDYSAIEAVLTGWFCRDPTYIRLARAGVHAYLTAHTVDPSGCPPKDALPPLPELKRYLKPFKSHKLYDVKKRTVHGVSYGLTAYGMAELYPTLFPKRTDAERELEFFFGLCPEVQRWQGEVRNKAARQNWLGGSALAEDPRQRGDHPFSYRHWFWDVVTWDSRRQEWKPNGKDINRVVAYYPQSTAAGVIKEALLRLMDPEGPYYVGDLGPDGTPIRALIHDSILFRVRKQKREVLLERATAAMILPVPELPCPPEWELGECLSIGVASKWGRNWAEMQEVA